MRSLKFQPVWHARVDVENALAQPEVPSLWVQLPDAGPLQTNRPFPNMVIGFLFLHRAGVFEYKHTFEVLGALVRELKSSLHKLHFLLSLESIQ